MPVPKAHLPYDRVPCVQCGDNCDASPKLIWLKTNTRAGGGADVPFLNTQHESMDFCSIACANKWIDDFHAMNKLYPVNEYLLPEKGKDK